MELLSPLSLATVLSCRRLWSSQPPGLVAMSEALRAAGSVLPPLLPKWFVPGEVEDGCAASLFRRTVEGAGLDCVSCYAFRVLCANCKVWFVISVSLGALSVKCNLSVDYE